MSRYDIVILEYCPRTEHSPDMPLKQPCWHCTFAFQNRGSAVRQCGFTPSVRRYCEANEIVYSFKTHFVCCLQHDSAKRAIQRLRRR